MMCARPPKNQLGSGPGAEGIGVCIGTRVAQGTRMRNLSLLFLLACAGCVAEPIGTAATNNAGIPVDLMFEHDGCRVYRFRDVGYHYFARCDGAGHNASVLPDRCGKNSQECGSVPTL